VTNSRVEATTKLLHALRERPRRPQVLVAASAIGFYGDGGDPLLDEDAPPGVSHLSNLCAAWERAAQEGVSLGMRVVSLRFGIVLSPRGGLLRKLLPVFSAGLGGRLGSGDAYQSFVAVDDAAAIVARALVDERLAGPVNAVLPEAVTNRDFTRILARVVHRPGFIAVPPSALRLAFGRLADDAMLTSTRAWPKRLAATGHRFRHPSLEAALRHVLGTAA
jgi:uncharacterized protein (TIGR01777 family)